MFRSRLIGQTPVRRITWPCDLVLWPWRSRRLQLMRVFVLRLCPKIEVRMPSHSEDIGHLLCDLLSAWWPWPFTFWPLNRFTQYSCDGLPSCQIWASRAFPFSSYIEARDRQTDRQTDKQTPFYNASFPTGGGIITQLHHLRPLCGRALFTKKENFVLSRRRASFDFHQILQDDRGGPCHHFTPKLLGPINSLAARGLSKMWLKTPPPR